ncbi:thioredoxin [Allobaculum mucilyticum]|uniref:thioredoxin n=1 Tax=Allobaculum mucilyticum TaxID=2834459 RepID=UPI001E3386C4|nr:thioredoxin [Allobaculum mucilyticum]UNT97284.1 thioredoxin [Allobaculum mucilyticum]
MAVFELSQASQFDEVLKDHPMVLADFFGSWCGPCQMIKPVLEQVSEHYEGKIQFVSVDIDALPELADRYDTESLPTLIFFFQQKKVFQISGYRDEETLCRLIDTALSRLQTASDPA